MSTKRILLVDDHLLFAEGLRGMLIDKGYEVGEIVTSSKDLTKAITNYAPDLLILDINMPEPDGIDCLKMVSKEFSEIRVIMLSMHEEISFVLSVLRLGAMGYVLKNNSSVELIQAIEIVSSGEVYYGADIKAKIVDNALLKNKKQQSSLIPKLTRRENQILDLIAQEHTSQEIAEKLCLSINTIETHRKHLFTKFDARNSVGLIRKAIDLGII
ncbi:MAG: response regulator [Cyclobacteriaceae bacterium]